MIPYNYVTCSQAQGLASDMKTGNKTSSLLFGIQWDLVCKYLEVNGDWDKTTNTSTYYINENSTNWGNYNNAKLSKLSGKYVIYDQNIYTLGDWNTIPSDYEKPDSGTENWVLLTTGASEDTKKMNIYDFAGNELEWTLEHATTETSSPYSYRGGLYYNTGFKYPASSRGYNYTNNSFSFFAFRATLY